MSTDDYRQQARTLKISLLTKSILLSGIGWCSGFITWMAISTTPPYQRLQQQLTEIDQEHGTGGNYLYYLATSPEYFGKIVQQLGSAGLTQEENGRWRRVIIEKPFGRDLDSRSLNETSSMF